MGFLLVRKFMSSVGRPFFQEFATSINPRGKCRLGYQNYTNSFFNANSFYVNFTNMTFQKIPIPHLTCMYYDSFSIANFASCCMSLLWLTQYFRRKKSSVNQGAGLHILKIRNFCCYADQSHYIYRETFL